MTERTIEVQPGKWVKVQHRTTGAPTKQETVDVGPDDTVTIKRAARLVQPGEDIAAAVLNDRVIVLAPGLHKPFVLNEVDEVDITFQLGAAISGAVRAIEVIGGSGYIRNPEVYDNGCGLQFRGFCSWDVFGGAVHHNQRMIRNDTIAGNDYGAMGFAFDDVSGWVQVNEVVVYSNRVNAATPSNDYGLNEGSAFELFKSRGVSISDCILYDNQVAVETGTNDAAKQCSFLFNNNRVWNGKTDAARKSKGLLLRTAVDSYIGGNTFDSLDEWAMNPSGGGGFGGSVEGMSIERNIAYTPSALIRLGGPQGAWSYANNGVAGTRVWGDVPAHGPTEAEPFVDRANHDYTLKPGSALTGLGWSA